MFKRIVLPVLILFIFSIFCSGVDYTNKEFASIMLSYNKTNPDKSFEKLINYLDENSWHLDAYYQLYSWCFEGKNFSPLKKYQEWDNSSEHLLWAYNQYSDKPSEDLLKTIYSITRKEKVSSYFAVLCADLINSLSDENLISTFKNQVLSSAPISLNDYVLKIKILLSDGEFDKSFELVSKAMDIYQDNPLLEFLYARHIKSISSVKEKLNKKDSGKTTTTFPDQQAEMINAYADALIIFNSNNLKQSYEKLGYVNELCEKYGFNLFRTELLIYYAQSAFNIRNTKLANELLDQCLDLLKRLPVPGYYYAYYKALGDLQTAENKFNEAFASYNNCEKYAEQPDQKGLLAIGKGFLLLKIRKYDLCLKVVDSAIPIVEKSGNFSVITGLYNLKAQALREEGFLSEALEVSKKSYEIVKKTDNKKYEVPILASMGNILVLQGKFVSAEKLNLEALKISREIGDVILEAKIYGSLAMIYTKMMEDAKSIPFSEKAIAIFEKYNDKYNLALAIGNMAQAYSNLGEYRKSLEMYQKATNLAREVNDIRSVGLYYTGMGSLYLKSGNLDKALNIYEEAEKVYKELNSDYYLARYYSNLANVYFGMEDYKKSDLYDQKAEELLMKIGENWSLYTIYSNQFSTGWATKDKNRMKNSLTKIEKLAGQMKEKYVDAEVNLLKGAFYNVNKKPVQARQLLLKALETFKHYRNNFIWVNYELGLSYKLEGNYKNALDYFSEAVSLSEKERYNLRLGDISTGFINTNKAYYYEYIDTLFLYYLKTRLPEIKEKLFSSIEQLKERNFIDQLSESRASLDVHISHELKGKEIDILGRIAKANTDINYASDDKELTAAETTLNTAEAELEQLKTEIRSQYPVYADVNYPSAVDISEIQKNIQDGSTGLLEYYIQDDYLYIFYIAKDRSMLWRKSNIKDITNKVRELYKYLQKPDPAEREKLDNAAAYLYNQLIYPIAKKADLKKNLIVIPDEILFYLPFDVLKDNKGKYMVESYNITYTPSATSMKLISKQELNRDSSLLAVANPAHEFLPEKEKTSEKTDTRDFDFNLVNQPLPNAEKEVSGISSFFDKNKKMTLVGKEAKEETIKSIDLKKFRFLHFATHGILDEEKPLRSGLLLAIDRDPKEDGILQYREIYDLKTNADLVVLSACKTGLGKIIKGDGLIGMSRGFLVSGSKSVIVSLWNVADYSTAILMQEFYRGLVRDGFTKAEALRKSKIALMKFTGETSSERGITGISGSRQSVKKKVDFSHPYFWASFIIMGSPGK